MKFPEFVFPDWRGGVDALRKSFFSANRAIESDLPDLAEISDLTIEGAEGPLKARLYVPLGAGIGPRPGILFFHGGGFVVCDMDTHDILCRRLAAASKCRVVSVDYRLAPETKFPGAHDDALASWSWIEANGETLGMDKDRMAVAGDSAGGNLAAFLAQETVRQGRAGPAFQLLLYPLVQFADVRADQLSFKEGGLFVSQGLFDYFRACYLTSEDDRMDKRVSPLFADADEFKGLAPAHLVLCGWDPLRHEGHAYAAKLGAHGTPVTVKEYKNMVHGFMNLTGVSVPAREAIIEAGTRTGSALGAR